MTVSTLIVSQALVQHQDGVSLHPDLLLWKKNISLYRQSWFTCSDKNPLAWYAALCARSATALLLEKWSQIPQDARQCWTVSPYHAALARNMIRVHPEGLFTWSVEDAQYICETLNPLIVDDGMELIAIGAALLLCCREPLDAYPQAFGEISGQMLPDRHHNGEDGGRLNRLLSEIQMLLFQHPSIARHDRGELDVSGIWLWSPLNISEQENNPSCNQRLSVATRNPVLQSIVDAQNASVIITEAERMHELLKQGEVLPKYIVLAGEGCALLLKKSIFPRLSKTHWHMKLNPKSVNDETTLLSRLMGHL